mgnify:CR=1 FL=1
MKKQSNLKNRISGLSHSLNRHLYNISFMLDVFGIKNCDFKNIDLAKELETSTRILNTLYVMVKKFNRTNTNEAKGYLFDIDYTMFCFEKNLMEEERYKNIPNDMKIHLCFLNHSQSLWKLHYMLYKKMHNVKDYTNI